MNPRRLSTVGRSGSIAVAVSFALLLSAAHAAPFTRDDRLDQGGNGVNYLAQAVSTKDEGELPDSVTPPNTVTLLQLLEEMSSPSSLARWPSEEWTGKQASALRVDKRHNVGFHAEVKEIGNYIREEKNENGQSELVLMEDLGPGVVVRIWFGNVEGNANTIIRMYFDGNKTGSSGICVRQLCNLYA